MTGFFIVAAVVLILDPRRRGAPRRGPAPGRQRRGRHAVPRDGQARQGRPRRPSRCPSTPRRRRGKEIERAAVLERTGGEIETVGDRGPDGVGAARPRDLRRHPPSVPQPLGRSLSWASASAPSAWRSSASCGRRRRAGSARSSASARSPTSRPTSRRATASSTARGPHVDHRVPGHRAAEGRGRVQGARCSPA